MLLIGITGRVREDIDLLAGYLSDRYGFARSTIDQVDPSMELDPELAVVIAGISNDEEARFVRRRGLLLHLRRPRPPADAHPLYDRPEIFREIDDVEIINDGDVGRFYKKVDNLLLMIKRFRMYGW